MTTTLNESALPAAARPEGDSAVASLTEELARLRAQVDNLEAALRSRQVIGVAMGILSATEHCGPDEAFDILRRASQRTNVKLRDLAAQICAARSRRVPAEPPASGGHSPAED